MPVTMCAIISVPDVGAPFTATLCNKHEGTFTNLVVNGNEVCFTYTPFGLGTDTVCVTICDAGGLCVSSESIITSSINNNPPVAINDTVEGYILTIPVLDNDFDPDGDNIFVTDIIEQPANGTATINADGTITYIPDEGFTGVDSFTYVICDDGIPSMCDTAIVYINVLPYIYVNFPPVFDLPNGETPYNTAITICVTITDPDVNDTFTAELCNEPSN